METYYTKIKKWGNSLAIIIDSLYVKENKLDEDDIVEVKISKTQKEKEIKSYKCRKCGHIFDSDDEVPYCPVCGEERLEVLKE